MLDLVPLAMQATRQEGGVADLEPISDMVRNSFVGGQLASYCT